MAKKRKGTRAKSKKRLETLQRDLTTTQRLNMGPKTITALNYARKRREELFMAADRKMGKKRNPSGRPKKYSGPRNT